MRWIWIWLNMVTLVGRLRTDYVASGPAIANDFFNAFPHRFYFLPLLLCMESERVTKLTIAIGAQKTVYLLGRFFLAERGR